MIKLKTSRKKHYYIICNGNKVGDSWAVSPEKAINNYWWVNDKECSPYTITDYRPEDYDAIEALD